MRGALEKEDGSACTGVAMQALGVLALAAMATEADLSTGTAHMLVVDDVQSTAPALTAGEGVELQYAAVAVAAASAATAAPLRLRIVAHLAALAEIARVLSDDAPVKALVELGIHGQ